MWTYFSHDNRIRFFIEPDGFFKGSYCWNTSLVWIHESWVVHVLNFMLLTTTNYVCLYMHPHHNCRRICNILLQCESCNLSCVKPYFCNILSFCQVEFKAFIASMCLIWRYQEIIEFMKPSIDPVCLFTRFWDHCLPYCGCLTQIVWYELNHSLGN